jgi:hypothetical protein
MAGQLKTRRSPQCATARRLSPHHKHIVPVARDLEVLAGEDTSTTIDSVDGDIAIMRIQLLTGVRRLLLSPNSERPVRRSGRAISSSRRLVSRDRNGDARAPVVAQIAGCGAQAMLPRTSHLHM